MSPTPRTTLPLLFLLSLSSSLPSVSAQGKVRTNATANAFEIVGNSLVSAQQLFLGTGAASSKVYIIDKTERNPTTIGGYRAWQT